MNFIALLLGLGIERLLTHLFHLREFRWLDPWIDRIAKDLENATFPVVVGGITIYALVTILPVAVVAWLLSDAFLQVPYFLLAVLVLLFSLGPRDLVTEVDDFCSALRDGREEDVGRIVRELREVEAPADEAALIAAVRRAVFVQANNRIFGVVFWFILLGPTGAWLFRVVDLLRRRMAYEYNREDRAEVPTAFIRGVRTVHGLLAWPSSRLLIAGYTLAGSYEGGAAAWKAYAAERAAAFYLATNDLLDRVGNGAVSALPVSEETPVTIVRVNEAINLVTRTLWLIWAPVIALLTLSGWLT